jgi:hypothetical protein
MPLNLHSIIVLADGAAQVAKSGQKSKSAAQEAEKPEVAQMINVPVP